MEDRRQANFRLPTEIVKQLRRRARREKRFPAHVVADALRIYFAGAADTRKPWDGRAGDGIAQSA